MTCHPASKHDPIPIHATAACPEEASQLEQEQQHHSNASHSSREFQEWRVLRFNEETVQSVARVSVGSSRSTEASVQQRPDCMAFLYMKTIGAAGSLQVFPLQNKSENVFNKLLSMAARPWQFASCNNPSCCKQALTEATRNAIHIACKALR